MISAFNYTGSDVESQAKIKNILIHMLNEFENNKQELWNKNMFGKPMNELVKDSIDSKLAGLPDEVQVKMRKTLTKIVNERKGGVICILL